MIPFRRNNLQTVFIYLSMLEEIGMAHNKKMKLQKRSRQSARIHRGFEMPVGMGSEDSILGFRTSKELKEKYFYFHGRVARRPFLMRTILLMIAQFMFTFILYLKLAEAITIGRSDFAALFGLLLVVLTIPTVWSELSLGWRRCHDINKSGALFIIPYLCYLGSFLGPILGLDSPVAMAVQSIMAVTYLGLFYVRGTEGDNASGPARSR